MSDIRIVRAYPHAPAKVWRALTEPSLMARWGMRPEGFAPIVGTKFTLRGEPNRFWRGFVECEVLEVIPERRLRHAWDDDGRDRITHVTYAIEGFAGGTRLTFEHVGFTGAGGFVFAHALMTPGWKKVFDAALPAMLSRFD